MRSLFILKPDVVRRHVINRVLGQVESFGPIVQLVMLLATEEELAQHYREHKEKDFYDRLIASMMSGPIVVGMVVGDVDAFRTYAMGVRAKYTLGGAENSIHASDSREAAIYEQAIWFPGKRRSIA